jgi:hypothetical protein
MWSSAEIVLKSYLPLELEEGMLFVNRIFIGVVEPYVELWELDHIPEDMDEFMTKHGAPVELLIIDEDGNILATDEEIGWWDEGENTDELRDITLDDINLVLMAWEGFLAIEIDEETEDPLIMEGRVVLSLDQEDINDWDVTLNDGLEEE